MGGARFLWGGDLDRAGKHGAVSPPLHTSKSFFCIKFFFLSVFLGDLNEKEGRVQLFVFMFSSNKADPNRELCTVRRAHFFRPSAYTFTFCFFIYFLHLTMYCTAKIRTYDNNPN